MPPKRIGKRQNKCPVCSEIINANSAFSKHKQTCALEKISAALTAERIQEEARNNTVIVTRSVDEDGPMEIIYDNPSADNHADHRTEPAQTTNDDPRDDESSDEDEIYATDAGNFDSTRPAHYKFATNTTSLTDGEQLSLELFQLVKSHGIGRDAHDALVKLMNTLVDKVSRNELASQQVFGPFWIPLLMN
ncbi:hypothetical protein BC941DRAFT_456297 [Chlamydoabsidia padenii]|nr:hypothetical protein BC941DRAFT_456297 [Chlamydoabsidia padenii]